MNKLLPIISLVLLLSACHTTPVSQQPQELIYGADVSDAFDTTLFFRIDTAFQRYINMKVLPHAVVMVVHDSRVAYLKSFGYSDVNGGCECRVDNVFREASQAKAISVITLMTLWEEGLFQLDEPIKKYLPEFAHPVVLDSYKIRDGKVIPQTHPAQNDITIRHLLTHTSGICYDGVFAQLIKQLGGVAHNSLDSISLQDNVRIMAQLPLKHEPGEAFTYSYGLDALAAMAELLTGDSFESLVQQRVLNPLGMQHTYFHLPELEKDNLVKLYSYTKQRGLCLSDNELLQTYPYAGAQILCSPSGGLVGTIEDYARFCQMILNGGTFNNQRIIGRKTLEMMQKNGVGQMRGEIGFGMAWDVFTPENAHNTIISEGSMRWGGMYGTDYVIDPQEKLILLMYSNCLPNKSGYNPKTLLHNVVYPILK